MNFVSSDDSRSAKLAILFLGTLAIGLLAMLLFLHQIVLIEHILLVFMVFFCIGRFAHRLPSLFNIARGLNQWRANMIATRDNCKEAFPMDDLPIALLSLSAEGRVINSNRAAQELLNIKPSEESYLNELVEGMGRSVSQWIKKTSQIPGWHKTEFAMAKRSDHDVYLRIQLGVVEVNKAFHTTALISDATELKSMEAQFVQSQKMQAIGQLAGGVAHDFNNLLTAISGYCDLLMLRHERGDADYGDLLQISSNANRAAALVGQLLAYSRKQTLKPSAIQINESLSDLTHLLNRLVGETITLRLVQEKELPLAFVDGRQLEQVLMNLVVNARDAMPDGGQIFLRSKTKDYAQDTLQSGVVVVEGEYVLIEVEDEGEGIEQAHLSKIFEPFFSTKDVGKGTGLGLSMAYGIIKQTGGYIFASSEVGKGTLFTILLPVAHDVRAVEAPKQVFSAPTANSLKGTRILLVEDEDPVRAVSQRALQSQGVNLRVAAGGAEALRILSEAERDFDVIITDVVMPDVDGPTWVKQAQAQGTHARLVFVSGYAEESFAQELENFKEAVFLPKPYSLQQLISTVSELAST